MKEFIKLFVPPFLTKIKSIVLNKDEQKYYNSYQDALKDSDIESYYSDDLINVIFEKTKIYKKELQLKAHQSFNSSEVNLLTAILLVYKFKKSETINVIDFGGACGSHYYQVRECLEKNIKLKYCVVETSAMVRKAKVLSSDELSFNENLENTAYSYNSDIDLIHTSGTLQSIDEPYKYLEKIFNCNATYILFNRLTMTTGNRDLITVQTSKLSSNGIGSLPDGFKDRLVKYPHINIRKSKFDSMLSEKYEIVYCFNETSGIIHSNKEFILGFGLLCKKKAVV
ncbi:MAG: methyltransferase, TIGR04325 family [Bacteroidia bacterium]